MNTLVLGIGNSILRDDGVGPAVIRQLGFLDCLPGVVLETANLSGLPLLDLVTGYDTLIVVDAIISSGKPGEIKWARLEDFQSPVHSSSQHRMEITRIIGIGAQLGIDVPADVRILTIEAQDVTSFGESLTPEVAAVVPEAAARIIREINGQNREIHAAGSCCKLSGARRNNINYLGVTHVENR
jgi:hydrogenase maturation protease